MAIDQQQYIIHRVNGQQSRKADAFLIPLSPQSLTNTSIDVSMSPPFQGASRCMGSIAYVLSFLDGQTSAACIAMC